MKLIKEVYESTAPKLDIDYRIRKAARAIIFNHLKEMAILHVSSDGYYKLPGGGVEQGEDIQQALRREVLEEVGVHIDILSELGITIEYREKINQLQLSYCFLTEVKDEAHVQAPTFTESEQAEGFKLLWVNFDEALQLMKKYKPEKYIGRFIVERDLAFLEEAKKRMI